MNKRVDRNDAPPGCVAKRERGNLNKCVPCTYWSNGFCRLMMAGKYPCSAQARRDGVSVYFQKKPQKRFRFNPDKRADDDPLTPSNSDCARWAEAALKRFGEEVKETVNEDTVCDLAADLLHFCDREGYDARKCVERALRHWEEER